MCSSRDVNGDFATADCGLVWLSRRLQPAASLMLKEFTGVDLDVDAKRVCMLESASVLRMHRYGW